VSHRLQTIIEFSHFTQAIPIRRIGWSFVSPVPTRFLGEQLASSGNIDCIFNVFSLGHNLFGCTAPFDQTICLLNSGVTPPELVMLVHCLSCVRRGACVERNQPAEEIMLLAWYINADLIALIPSTIARIYCVQ
jgi:hypothetical protein